MSPRTANVRALTTAFYNADLKPNIKMETLALKKADPDGDLVCDHDGLATHTASGDAQVSKWSVLGCAITLFGVAMYNRGK